MHYFFDSAFPAGSYGHSFGFETFATSKSGSNKGHALEWIRNYMIFSLWYGDVENISRARLAIADSPVESDKVVIADELDTADRRLHASRSTNEARKSAESLARSMKIAASRLFGEAFTSVNLYGRSFREPSTFVALLSYSLGWNEEYTRLLYLQGQALSATSVLVRCGKIGQFTQLEMMAELIDLSAKLASQRPPPLPNRTAVTSWAIEIDQIDHQNLSPRLFQS
jgi:urease accessory protein